MGVIKKISSILKTTVLKKASLLKYGSKPKVFVIGLNKTGTTSIKWTLKGMGFEVGNQIEAERLLKDYLNKDYRQIIKYCKSAEAFQDIPFSLKGIYKILDSEFPNSKFILSVRNSPEQWYNSLTKFHSGIFNLKRIPTALELKTKENYRYEHWFYDAVVKAYKTPDDNPYQRDILIKYYKDHIQEARDYFKNRPQNFIEINVSKPEDFKRLGSFLGKKTKRSEFIHFNKTNELKNKPQQHD